MARKSKTVMGYFAPAPRPTLWVPVVVSLLLSGGWVFGIAILHLIGLR